MTFPSQNHPLLAAELARIESRQPLEPLDTTRHQLPGPQNPSDEEEWKAAVKSAYAQLEHQRLRYVFSIHVQHSITHDRIGKAYQYSTSAAVRPERMAHT